ncbi:MAG: hypothetical protein II220_01670 [Spirochaetales bacterium]|nr:hypothetical protein [Spirochaetales bacterium]
MTKRFLSVMAMVSVVAMMMLSSCTTAGVECGLIGKWEMVQEYYEGYKQTIEITTDDKITFISPQMDYDTDKVAYQTRKGTIEEVTGKAIIYKMDGIEGKSVLEYSDLNGDTVKFQNSTFKKVQ